MRELPSLHQASALKYDLRIDLWSLRLVKCINVNMQNDLAGSKLDVYAHSFNTRMTSSAHGSMMVNRILKAEISYFRENKSKNYVIPESDFTSDLTVSSMACCESSLAPRPPSFSMTVKLLSSAIATLPTARHSQVCRLTET